MTMTENMGLGKSNYGFAWNITKTGFDHGGAYKNAMSIDTTTGRVLVFMVQQQGDWGTDQGKQIVSTLKQLSNDIVGPPTAAHSSDLAPAAH
jgi:hypothetical protein